MQDRDQGETQDQVEPQGLSGTQEGTPQTNQLRKEEKLHKALNRRGRP